MDKDSKSKVEAGTLALSSRTWSNEHKSEYLLHSKMKKGLKSMFAWSILVHPIKSSRQALKVPASVTL